MSIKSSVNEPDYNDFAYCWFPGIMIPPEEGGQERDSEWLKVPLHYNADEEFTMQLRCTFPHRFLFQHCPVIILGSDATILKCKTFPKWEGVKVPTVLPLLADSWNTEETRCKDCPEWPWHILFKPELLEFRAEDKHGDENMTVSSAVDIEMRSAKELNQVISLIIEANSV